MAPEPLTLQAERRLLRTLAAVQFTHVADFMMLSPLGPTLMRTFQVGPGEVGVLVSAYTFSSAVAGLLTALFIDRFDRRKALLTMFAGFLIAVLACGIVPGYPTLLVARIFAGAFGGVLGAMVYTVLGDTVPEERRGRATGMVASGLALAGILGVPIGLYSASLFGWQAPYLFLTAMAGLVLLAVWFTVPSLTGHLRARRTAASPNAAQTGDETTAARMTGWREHLRPMREVLGDANHRRAYVFIALVILSGFSVIPYVGMYVVATLGVEEKHLATIYLVGGLVTLVTVRVVGVLADRYGKRKVYRCCALASIVPLIVTTHLPPVPFWVVMTVAVVFFMLVPSRLIPAMAIVTSAAIPRLRGTFLSVNSAVHSLSSGAASLIGGLIIARSASGAIIHYDRVGYFAVAATLLGVWWVGRVHNAEDLPVSEDKRPDTPAEAVRPEEANAIGARSEDTQTKTASTPV